MLIAPESRNKLVIYIRLEKFNVLFYYDSYHSFVCKLEGSESCFCMFYNTATGFIHYKTFDLCSSNSEYEVKIIYTVTQYYIISIIDHNGN